MIITANEVKTRGVSAFGNLLQKFDELIINVRGKNKYVVLDIKRYKQMRENELDLAYLKTMQAIKAGEYKSQTADQHIQDVKNALQNH